MEFVRFISEDKWHFAGFIVVIWIAGGLLEALVQAWRSK